MAIKGISFGKRHEYICREDPSKTKEDGATVFYWNALPNEVVTRISDAQATSQVDFTDGGKQIYFNKANNRNRECFRHGVKGWDNFFDDDGAPIAFKTDTIMEGRTYTVVSDDCLNRIRLETINEVGTEIYSESSLSEEKRKNFVASLLQLGGSKSTDATTATTTQNETGDASNPPTVETPS